MQPTAYNPRLPLFWSLDFNINPMCSVIGQRDGEKVHILDEMVLPDSNSLAACEEFLSRTRSGCGYRTFLSICPSTAMPRAIPAGRRRRAPTGRSFGNFFGRYRDRFDATSVRSSNPPVKDRVNCVNAMLRNQAGERRLLIDPGCKQLIQDFERVHWKSDPNGNLLGDIDKSDPTRSHASDALGYMIAREFPMRASVGERPGVLQ